MSDTAPTLRAAIVQPHIPWASSTIEWHKPSVLPVPGQEVLLLKTSGCYRIAYLMNDRFYTQEGGFITLDNVACWAELPHPGEAA